ncbi:hypothetical protein SKAU_G00015200 [Synaphobranchus kaupii]|uniref:Uncharacterized protein n=1 Tax=Synaphobranchus kaupii TaxID=118154 RepID=A0A9Q1JDR1_SYNKA|nr:hypothetical protein SKAU_G00015200 [Synaphobranchus kaupii]
MINRQHRAGTCWRVIQGVRDSALLRTGHVFRGCSILVVIRIAAAVVPFHREEGGDYPGRSRDKVREWQGCAGTPP